MPIINAHVHMIELEKALPQKKDIPPGIAIFKNLDEAIKLLNLDCLFSQMEEAGIDKAALFACAAPIIYASNEYVAGLCRKYPERLIGFASVDPFRKDAPAVIEKAIKELGLKGVKFHPPLQNFYPNEKQFFPIYRKAAEMNVPVVFHTGSTPFGKLVRLDQANPLLLDEIAVEFPGLKIILTHLGTLWYNEAFMVVEKNPNVFIDTATYIYEIGQLLTSDLIARLGENKFIFGTDYPTPFGGKTHRMKDFVEAVKGLRLPDKVKEMIFYRNFAQIINEG